MVDGALADGSVHRALLDRLARAGLGPVYRRFDPRLADADIDRYRVIVWLAGRARGSSGSLAVSPVEVDRAVRFVRRGGRLVLGVLAGEGVDGAEARAQQAVLDRLGIEIVVEPHEVTDDDREGSYPGTLFRAPLFEPDPERARAWRLPSRIVGERSAPLRIGPGALAHLWTLPTAYLDLIYGPRPTDRAAFGRRAVVAEGSAGGRVLVASRTLLDAGGAALAATAEPALPGRLPDGALAGRDRFLASLVARFAGAGDAADPDAAAIADTPLPACGSLRPGEAWVDREGLKAGWGYIDQHGPGVDALLARLPGSGLNAFWGAAVSWRGLAWPARDPAAAAAAEGRASRVERALRGTGVRWLAGVEVPGRDPVVASYPRAVALGGRSVGVPSLVDRRLWQQHILPQVRGLASRAAEGAPLAGIVLDLEMYEQALPYYGDAFDFGDRPFLAYLDAAAASGELGPAEAREAERLEPPRRADWLLAAGRLAAYYAWLGAQAEGIGRRLRAAVDEAAPGRDLVLGFYAVTVLPQWFYQGLWRGASSGGRPIVLMTFQPSAGRDLERRVAEGLCARHALAALMGLAGREGLSPLLARAGHQHDGFWLNRMTALVAPPGTFEAVEEPAGGPGESAWGWIRDAVGAFERARSSRAR